MASSEADRRASFISGRADVIRRAAEERPADPIAGSEILFGRYGDADGRNVFVLDPVRVFDAAEVVYRGALGREVVRSPDEIDKAHRAVRVESAKRRRLEVKVSPAVGFGALASYL